MAYTPSPFVIPDRWAGREQVVYGRLWYEFLLFSPSYELARKARKGLLNAKDRERLPKDMDTVFAVYDDLGDVLEVGFETWWMTNALRYFGYQGEIPRARPIFALLPGTEEPWHPLAQKGYQYINGAWQDQGQQPSLIVAIPLGVQKAELLKQISDMIDVTPEEHREIKSVAPKYKIHGRKKDVMSCARLLTVMSEKAVNPKGKLHEIGASAMISTTYSARVSGNNDVEDRKALKILTSRALNRAHLTAENAARGIFPTYSKCEHAVAMDWDELRYRLAAHYGSEGVEASRV